MPELRQEIAQRLKWEDCFRTTRPKLFQLIRDELEDRRKTKELTLLLSDLEIEIQSKASHLLKEDKEDGIAEDTVTDAIESVCEQMSLQGRLVQTMLPTEEDVLVLQIPVVERYAGSLIIAARDNSLNVPALDSHELGSPNIHLPKLETSERASRKEEIIVLGAIIELMIKHRLCFRHSDLLVFPTLLRKWLDSSIDDCMPASDSSQRLYYRFSGAIDSVYAALICTLVFVKRFGHVRLWQDRAAFGDNGEGVCWVAKDDFHDGSADLRIHFEKGTSKEREESFLKFAYQALKKSDPDVEVRRKLICPCGHHFSNKDVQDRLKVDHNDEIGCPICDRRVDLQLSLEPVSEARFLIDREKHENEAAQVEAGLSASSRDLKFRVFGSASEATSDRLIRILHISDLHFRKDTEPKKLANLLITDIQKWLTDPKLDFLVVSGDLTHQGTTEGFQKAREFLGELSERLKIGVSRFIVVPGNHDLEEGDRFFTHRRNPTPDELKIGVRQGEVYILPDPETHKLRLKSFSDLIVEPFLSKYPYPHEPDEQGEHLTFYEEKLQFLAFNSCWEIDEYHRTRVSLNAASVARVIAEADDEVRKREARPEDFARIAVFHHSAKSGREIGNSKCLQLLSRANVRLCLHGDLHRMNRDTAEAWGPNRMEIVGAGSFSAESKELDEGSHRLYNVLEFNPLNRKTRVYTREQEILDGPWRKFVWPNRDGTDSLPYFEIEL